MYSTRQFCSLICVLALHTAAANEHLCVHSGIGATATLDCTGLNLAAIPASVYTNDWTIFNTLEGATPANTHRFKQLNDDADTKIWAMDTGTHMFMLIESGSEAAIFDCPETSSSSPSGSALEEDLNLLLSVPLTHIFMTHDHYDHVGDCGKVKQLFPNAVAHGTEYLRQVMTDRNSRTDTWQNKGVPVPTFTFQDGDALTVGSVSFTARVHDGHKVQDAVFVFEKDTSIGLTDKVVMSVDILFPGWSPFFNLALSTDVPGYFDAMDLLASFNADVHVAGHLTRLGTHTDVVKQIAYFNDIIAGMKQAFATVNSGALFGGSGIFTPGSPAGIAGNNWLASNELFATWVDTCEAYVLDAANRDYDWLAELAGVQITLRSHCQTINDALRVGEDFAVAALAHSDSEEDEDEDEDEDPVAGAAVGLPPSVFLSAAVALLALASSLRS